MKPKDFSCGYIFGSSSRLCDVVINSIEDEISRVHFYVTFNRQGRLVLKDLSRAGTAVMYNGEAVTAPRTNFEWILFEESLKIDIKAKGTHFAVEIPSHQDCAFEYEDRLRSYLAEAQKISPAIHGLNLGSSGASIVASAAPDDPRTSRAYAFLNELGKGEFGAVYRALDASNEVAYAVKKSFKITSQWPRETRLLARIKHVRCAMANSFSNIAANVT